MQWEGYDCTHNSWQRSEERELGGLKTRWLREQETGIAETTRVSESSIGMDDVNGGLADQGVARLQQEAESKSAWDDLGSQATTKELRGAS